MANGTKPAEAITGTLNHIASSILHEPHGDIIVLKRTDAAVFAKTYLEQPKSMMAVALEDLDTIERKQLEAFDLRTKRDDLAEVVAGIEASIMDEVAAMKDIESGKPLYTNDTTRKAAASKKKSDHVGLRDAHGQLRTVERALAQLEANINTLQKNVSIRQAILGGR